MDAQNGKPSSGKGSLECNKTYEANLGFAPIEADLSTIRPAEIETHIARSTSNTAIDVLISCAPCTGFSRTIRRNLVEDDSRNSLVTRSADFVEYFRPKIFLMENVGELLMGNFSHHFSILRQRLTQSGYSVSADVHSLDKFGLPQRRRRALVIAVRSDYELHTLDEIWAGYRVIPSAVTVRRAIASLPPIGAGERHPLDPSHVSPNFSPHGLERLKRIPPDGGSWPDLLKTPDGDKYLIPSMARHVARGRVGPHPDVYGRLAWDQPSVTIKRECAHTGNGRYAHPEQNRLCTVRELGILQGFPRDYQFVATSISNMYRHVGDAVPPLVSYQIAQLTKWILTGKRPDIQDLLLPGTHLKANDLIETDRPVQQLSLACVG